MPSWDEISKIPATWSDEYQNLTSEKEEYLKEYQTWHETWQLGEWITAHSKTNDMIATLKRVEVEMQLNPSLPRSMLIEIKMMI